MHDNASVVGGRPPNRISNFRVSVFLRRDKIKLQSSASIFHGSHRHYGVAGPLGCSISRGLLYELLLTKSKVELESTEFSKRSSNVKLTETIGRRCDVNDDAFPTMNRFR